MKKKLTTAKIVAAVNVLSDEKTRLSRMAEKDRFAVVRTLFAARPISEAIDKFTSDARDRLKPENFDELQKKAQDFDSLTDEEKLGVNKAFIEYDNAVKRCIADELAKERELEVYPLGDDGFNKFMASNENMSPASFLAVMELMKK